MITVVGLGPAALDLLPTHTRAVLEDPAAHVIVRTLRHPAAADLAERREVETCDDLYETADTFDGVYAEIESRVVERAKDGPVVYAVPGSPFIGEFAVGMLVDGRPEIEVIAGESFVDAVCASIGYDPLERGLQIVNGHDLPDPLVLDKPTIIGHLDRAEGLADALAAISRVIPPEAEVTLLAGAGDPDADIVTGRPEQIDIGLAGLRTSLFVDVEPGGLVGAVHVMRRLREECPWDREQSHRSLLPNLVEEVYELMDAIEAMPVEGDDWVAYAAVEDELGDVLLQVLFHEAIARESGGFDIDGVAEVLRQKLVRRHPHVFADVVAHDAATVKRNWDSIKEAEAGGRRESALDGVPSGMPALQRASKLQNRAAKVGFDWPNAPEVLAKVSEELAELTQAIADEGDTEAELGDLIFTVVNVARHLGVDPELALRRSISTFERRFRAMEREGSLDGLELDDLNERWERAKSAEDT